LGPGDVLIVYAASDALSKVQWDDLEVYAISQSRLLEMLKICTRIKLVEASSQLKVPGSMIQDIPRQFRRLFQHECETFFSKSSDDPDESPFD